MSDQVTILMLLLVTLLGAAAVGVMVSGSLCRRPDSGIKVKPLSTTKVGSRYHVSVLVNGVERTGRREHPLEDWHWEDTGTRVDPRVAEVMSGQARLLDWGVK